MLVTADNNYSESSSMPDQTPSSKQAVQIMISVTGLRCLYNYTHSKMNMCVMTRHYDVNCPALLSGQHHCPQQIVVDAIEAVTSRSTSSRLKKHAELISNFAALLLESRFSPCTKLSSNQGGDALLSTAGKTGSVQHLNLHEAGTSRGIPLF